MLTPSPTYVPFCPGAESDFIFPSVSVYESAAYARLLSRFAPVSPLLPSHGVVFCTPASAQVRSGSMYPYPPSFSGSAFSPMSMWQVLSQVLCIHFRPVSQILRFRLRPGAESDSEGGAAGRGPAGAASDGQLLPGRLVERAPRAALSASGGARLCGQTAGRRGELDIRAVTDTNRWAYQFAQNTCHVANNHLKLVLS